MKKLGTRALGLVLCLGLLLCLGLPARAAGDSYLITVAENEVLEDTGDDSMAVYIDGIIYTPYTTLQKLNGVWASYNPEEQKVTVYQLGYVMYFELDTGLTYDYSERYIRVSAKLRGEVPYLPVQVICSWMGLYYSFTSAADAGLSYPILRLAAKTPATTDSALFTAKAETLRTVARARDKLSGIDTGEPDTPAVPDPRDVYLLFTGAPGEELPQLLDTLENSRVSAAFFLPAEGLAGQGEALREIWARGFSPGLLLTGEDPLAEATAAADACARILRQRVRLVMSGRELSPEEKTALSEGGFVLWVGSIDVYAEGMSASRLISQLRRALWRAADGERVLLRPDDRTLEVLPVLCSYLVAQNFTARPVWEWTKAP